jgi:hypothetical protein
VLYDSVRVSATIDESESEAAAEEHRKRRYISTDQGRMYACLMGQQGLEQGTIMSRLQPYNFPYTPIVPVLQAFR